MLSKEISSIYLRASNTAGGFSLCSRSQDYVMMEYINSTRSPQMGARPEEGGGLAVLCVMVSGA